jgi:TonB-dependent Receptor Plug Domain
VKNINRKRSNSEKKPRLFTCIRSSHLKHLLLITALAVSTPFRAAEPEVAHDLSGKTRRKIVLKSEAEKQAIGRSTLSGDQIRNTPATFGDALNALTSMPGISRPDVLFGNLVIRGAGNEANRFFVDGIPIPRPQHFGGLHSVLNNDIVQEANVYASAFPVTYGGATGAVLEFKTIDEVDKLGAVIDIGLVSANFLLKATWPGGENRPEGYWISAGRVGYLPLIIPPIYKAITGDTFIALPQYYDYQLKGKIALDQKGEHSLTLLALGSYDVVEVLRRANSGESYLPSDLKFIRPGAAWELSSHSLALYYDYEPSRKMKNHLLVFNTLVSDQGSFKSSTTGESEYTKTQPNLAGIKNNLSFIWLEGSARLNLGIEYSLYYLASAGSYADYIYSSSTESRGYLTETRTHDDRRVHHVPSGYIENKFQWGALRIVPGVRADYLPVSTSLAVGPRGLAGYDFATGTTVEIAGGVYHSFPQVNITHLETYSYHLSAFSGASNLRPEEAVHRSLAVSQKYKLWDFRIEGYLNDIYRQIGTIYGQSSTPEFGNLYATKNMGAEFSIRKMSDGTGVHDFYGWTSYTLSRSVTRDQVSEYDQTHNLKLVVGYIYGIHNLSLRTDIYSGFAYFPITGSEPDLPSTSRHYPLYDTSRSARYPIAHRISIRYSQERIRAWGSWRWYFEVVNATNSAPQGQQVFNSSRPYQEGVNPTLEPLEPRIPILPNFGVEIRF